jgi:HPt (histidine-containing phosphotransfer) domain-containing protein
VDTLRVLTVGAPQHLERISSALTKAGHAVIAVEKLEAASEALSVQRFDAVLLGGDLPASEVQTFSTIVKDLQNRAGSASRLALLSVASDSSDSAGGPGGVDGVVPEDLDPDSLTLAIARLASAVSTGASSHSTGRPPELAILEIENLKEQVAYDDDLLIELIDLFLAERLRQSAEMRETLSRGEFEKLSRVAHTIKGSLASLHATLARSDAQALELAAKEGDKSTCEQVLHELEHNLDVLEEHLVALRRCISAS